MSCLFLLVLMNEYVCVPVCARVYVYVFICMCLSLCVTRVSHSFPSYVLNQGLSLSLCQGLSLSLQLACSVRLAELQGPEICLSSMSRIPIHAS